MSILDEIGRKHGTDKSSLVHDYLRKYEKYFFLNRNDKIKILEIGVQDGASLRTWKEYFFNAQIFGLDINPECKKYEEERITIEIGSQTDENFLKEVCNQYGPFDVIIDDGSHINSHVIFSFKVLFNYLKPQGLYLVEDTTTSYWESYGGSPKGPDTMISYFKEIIDEVNFGGEMLESGPKFYAREDSKLIKQFEMKGYNPIGIQIESINFINSAILINKR